MGIHVALHHQTLYRYDRRINLGPQIVRLRPAPHCRTPILSYSLTVHPSDHFLNWQQDPFSNYLGRLVFLEKTDQFRVEVDLVAEMVVVNPFDFFLEPAAEKCPFPYEPELAADLAPYLARAEAGKGLQRFLATVPRQPEPTIDFLVWLNQRLTGEISYLIRMEPNVQSCEQTLALGSGSCRDSAWLLVNILRHLGLAARFVSGYLIQLAQDVKSLDGPSGPAADFTDLHAWAEVYLPGAGWVGMDPTSGLFAGEGHIPLACSPEPQSAAPVSGALELCEVEFSHHMAVQRVAEAPRATRPYPEEVWSAIVDLGEQVEAQLQEADVRLSMGGEPTFVAIDGMDEPQWNGEALGVEKQQLAEKLFHRLQGRWAPGGLRHYGQGKWYPGESLPRWSLACYWRRDGQPLWRDETLLADPGRDYGFGAEAAERFLTALVDRLGVSRQYIRPAYEDPLGTLLGEAGLPINLDPTDPALEHEEGRIRLLASLRRGLGAVVGYVLPLQYGSWKSGPWPLRSPQLYLLSGDSPVGLRLPLASLPWVAAADLNDEPPLDPMAPRPPLAMVSAETEATATGERSGQSQQQPAPDPEPPLAPGESAAWLVRTALCVQPRDGRLYLFMPPIPQLEGYLELITLIEETVRETGLPVLVEGYPPPADHRLESFKVTPDPGVIEVNIQPMGSWAELVRGTTELYEMAREGRLATEKFLLDGRQTGTGGGNHIVLGGMTPADSPFLRRPDLLRSFITFWNNHPSLSYLFSGLFIGPTSQQPRLDEARHDSLYELEIAFAELDRLTTPDQPCPPWLVDRLFRHLLVDVSGNTHRAEFCIDKLYSPDSAAGRLGLLEFRAFEMPPHARMSLAQQLLLRACVAWFWRTPYRRPLVRWGTRLHDRFMLPELVRADFADLLQTLVEAGYPLRMEFFHPHFEFRFPILGQVHCLGMTLELRQALEPWHVLGEEPGGGGTVRYVDSSVERLQLKVSGMVGERYLLLCNGRQVPLQPTTTAGVLVGGVRFRAWQPAACLHPTLGVHAPLVIDLYDSWSGRAVGGCTYHVGHPGGRNFDEMPINAQAAEGRRNARFIPGGHSPGTRLAHPSSERNRQFPCTLDLRWPALGSGDGLSA